jgi:uncharacterized protein YbbC (DUF1343 family)
VVTGTCIMLLIERGNLQLTTKVSEHFPEFAAHGKADITIQDLLVHQSGLIPDNPLSDYAAGPERTWQNICQLKLIAPVGSAFKYSDVNFIVLGKLIEKIAGMDLHQFSQREIFQPLAMRETGFLPLGSVAARAAPTEQRDGVWIQGEVHDPRAHALGGIAGHAGLFSTAQDLAKYASMMLSKGSFALSGQPEARIMAPQTVLTMTNSIPVSTGIRGLSWDKKTSYSINRGRLLSSSAFGHGGFTGTVLWIDSELDLFVIFLSNRLHPNGKGQVNPLAGKIVDIIASSIKGQADELSAKPPLVLTGLDVLRRDQFRQLAGQRVGLIANHTSRTVDGQSAVRLLTEAKGMQLVSLFSPEHGFEGKLDLENVPDSHEAQTGLKIHSLYGQSRRPTAEMCSDIDTLVFDIQDIGTRFYTYVSTMSEAMQACHDFHKRFVVLDRPNPLGGLAVAGPMLDKGTESFVGCHQLPVRHGMTMGELAQLIKAEKNLNVDLQIVACEGWSRQGYWDETGLIWIKPSPNMRSLTQALLYPGVGLWEMTNISVGRGSDTPFELLGAPWINPTQLAAELRDLNLPGLTFVPVEFTPGSSKYAGELCKGVNIVITNRRQFEPLELGFALAVTLRKLYPNQWQTQNLNRLLGSQACSEAILAGHNVRQLCELSRAGISEFMLRRELYLLYK